MSVTVPDDFQILRTGGAEVIGHLEPILADAAEQLTLAATWVYARGGRRVAFNKGFLGGGVQTTSSTYVQVYQQTFKLSALRSKLDFHFATTNCDIKIEIWTSDLTTLEASVEDTTGSGTSASITSGVTAGAQLVAKVYIKTNTAGTARLDTVRGVERALTAAELP